MPHKYFEDQFDDEEVLFVFRKHPVVMRKGLVLGMIGILLPVVFVGVWTELALRGNWTNQPTMGAFFGSLIIGLLLGGLLYFPSWIAWYYSLYIVTDQRFIQVTHKGLFHKSLVDIGLDKIQSINYEVAGFQETLLGYGTLLIQTYMGDLVIHDIHHPAKINKKLNELLRKLNIAPDMLEPEQA